MPTVPWNPNATTGAMSGKNTILSVYDLSDTATITAPQGLMTKPDFSNVVTFDDVDDYNNWQQSPPQAIDGTALSSFSKFSRTVNIQYVTISGADWISSSETTYYKRITVIVSHPKISDRRLETIVSHY